LLKRENLEEKEVEGLGLNNDVKEGLEKGSGNMHFLFHESKKIPHYPPPPSLIKSHTVDRLAEQGGGK
jgi:hypothetical protein